MHKGKDTDDELLQLLVQNPQAGLQQLLEQYGGLIAGIIFRVLGDAPQDAEECVSDVLAAAWQNAERLYRKKQPLKPWLIVISRNNAIDRYRSLRRRLTEELDETVVPDWMQETQQSSDGEEVVESLVNGMPQPDREIFLRRYYLMESSKEIGEALGMDEHVVNIRLSRGRKRLKEEYIRQMGKEAGSHA